MARLIKDRVALGVKDESILIDVMLEMYRKGLWDQNCVNTQNSFLKWVMPFRDTLEALFDKARTNGITAKYFPTNDSDGHPGEQVKLRGLNEEQAKKAKEEHLERVIHRRSRMIIEKSRVLGLTQDELVACFPDVQQEEPALDRIERKIAFLGESIVELDRTVNQAVEQIDQTTLELRQVIDDLRKQLASLM